MGIDHLSTVVALHHFFYRVLHAHFNHAKKVRGVKMNELTTCNQHGCDKPAEYRFTWPGQDEAGVCRDHKAKLEAVANAMGFHLQVMRVREASDD